MKAAIDEFGSSTIVYSLDIVRNNNEYFIFNNGQNIRFNDMIDKINDIEFGEILINSVNNDGMMSGLILIYVTIC